MKVPLSRSDGGGGGGLLARAVGTAALAAVLALSTGTAMAATAAAAEPPAGPQAPAVTAAKPTLKVVVVGDSFTSGEGASLSTFKTVPVPDVTEDGIAFTDMKIDPAHQSSTAPTLQALNQIQAANPGVDLQVTFVPVSGATRTSLYQTTQPGTPFEQPPQIDAVAKADVVIVGIGGNDARFSDWITTVLSSKESTSTAQFPTFMQQFNDGTYLNNQVNLLNDISDRASPNATIISLGYPKAMPDTIPGTPTWWSPFSWSTISQGEAQMSNQLATTLNTNNQDASFIAAGNHPSQNWIYADVSTALQGHELFTDQEGLNGVTPSNKMGSYHPNDLGQQLLGASLQPYLQQAVNGQLARIGVQGAEDVPAITPTFANKWNLRVDVPLQEQQSEQSKDPSDEFKNELFKLPPAQDFPDPGKTPDQKQDQQQSDQQQGDQQGKPVDQPSTDQPNTDKSNTDKPDADQPSGDQQPAAPAQGPQPTDVPADNNAAPSGTDAPADTPADSSGAAPAGGDVPASPNSLAVPDGTTTGAPTDDTEGSPADGPPPDGDAAVTPTNTSTDTTADTPEDGSAGAPADGTGLPLVAPDSLGTLPPALPDVTAPDTGAAPTDDTPGATADGPPAAVDTAPDTGDLPAVPAPVDTPAPVDVPAAPDPVDEPAPVDVPAAPAPVDTPAPVDVPAVPDPVDVPAPPVEVPAAPVIVDVPPPPVIEAPPPPPPPVIAPPPIPEIAPVNPVDTGTSVTGGDEGLGVSDGLGTGDDTGLGSVDDGGLGSGLDTGGFDGGGDAGGGD